MDIIIGAPALSRGSQSLDGEWIDENHSPKLRAIIKRDYLDRQSWAKVQAWSAEKGWLDITSRPIKTCAIFAFSFVQEEGVWADAMRADLADLLNLGSSFFFSAER